MKIERKKGGLPLLMNYDDLIAGHLYIDASDPDELDVYLATDDGVVSLDQGDHYSATDSYEFPINAKFREVGGKVVIEE